MLIHHQAIIRCPYSPENAEDKEPADERAHGDTRSSFTNRFLSSSHFYQPKKVIRIKAKNLKLLVIANRSFVLPDNF